MIFFITKGKLSYYTKHLWRFIALCLHIINKPDKFNMFIYLKKKQNLVSHDCTSSARPVDLSCCLKNTPTGL